MIEAWQALGRDLDRRRWIRRALCRRSIGQSGKRQEQRSKPNADHCRLL
jgi:hypothetical protein